jgi:hypothetical protein
MMQTNSHTQAYFSTLAISQMLAKFLKLQAAQRNWTVGSKRPCDQILTSLQFSYL